MPRKMQTDEPVTAALKPLMRERGLTFRGLADLTQAHDDDGRGVTFAYLCALTSGREYPSRRSLELIAASLGIEPATSPSTASPNCATSSTGREVGFQAAWRRYLELAR